MNAMKKKLTLIDRATARGLLPELPQVLLELHVKEPMTDDVMAKAIAWQVHAALIRLAKHAQLMERYL